MIFATENLLFNYLEELLRTPVLLPAIFSICYAPIKSSVSFPCFS